jgi:hypothetical protein
VQQIFDPLTSSNGLTKYVTTEFGVGLALGYTILAFYFWRRRDEVEAGSQDASRTFASDRPTRLMPDRHEIVSEEARPAGSQDPAYTRRRV